MFLGELQPLTDEILDAIGCRELIFAVLKEQQRAKLEHEWELDFALQVENLGRFRGSASYVLGHVEASFRFIPNEIPELRDLGHGPTVERFCSLHEGLVLITGMSGCGKTTTLASMTQKISREQRVNVVSIEDPIEYVFSHGSGLVKQRQVGADTHNFPDALRNALRGDADVIVIGEMRDLETMRAAIRAAETGHLVISTLHTTEATTTISRIFDAFPEEQQDYLGSQLAACLQGVVCQHLIPRLDQPGRVLASEVMTRSSGIAACIRRRNIQQIPGLIQLGGSDGMHSIDDSLAHLMQHGFISLDDAVARCRDKSMIRAAHQDMLKSQNKK